MSNTKQIIFLNSSAVRVSSCMRRLYLTIISGYKKKINSQSIEFGSAFHLCAKVTELTEGNIGRGVQAACKYYRETPYEAEDKKKYLDESYLTTVCLNWFDEFYMQDNFITLRDINQPAWTVGDIEVVSSLGKPLVEVKFEIPFYSSDKIDVIITGTIDRIAQHKTSKLLAHPDYKTTGSWNSEEYLRGYVLSGQLYMYALALRKTLDMCNEQSVLYPFKNKKFGSFIDGIFLSAPSTKIPPRFIRSEAFIFTENQLNDFEKCLLDLCYRLEAQLNFSTEIPLPDGLLNDSCSENKFGGKCNFFNYCACGDKIAQEHVLRKEFIQEPYGPTK